MCRVAACTRVSAFLIPWYSSVFNLCSTKRAQVFSLPLIQRHVSRPTDPRLKCERVNVNSRPSWPQFNCQPRGFHVQLAFLELWRC